MVWPASATRRRAADRRPQADSQAIETKLEKRNSKNETGAQDLGCDLAAETDSRPFAPFAGKPRPNPRPRSGHWDREPDLEFELSNGGTVDVLAVQPIHWALR